MIIYDYMIAWYITISTIAPIMMYKLQNMYMV